MNTEIWVAIIFAVVGMISPIFFGFVPRRRKDVAEKLKTLQTILYKDITLFYSIEEHLINELSKIIGENSETIKK